MYLLRDKKMKYILISALIILIFPKMFAATGPNNDTKGCEHWLQDKEDATSETVKSSLSVW